MARSPQIRVSLSEKEYEQIQKVARKLKVSDSMLCRNLMRCAIDDLTVLDRLKLTDLVGLIRRSEESMGRKLVPVK